MPPSRKQEPSTSFIPTTSDNAKTLEPPIFAEKWKGSTGLHYAHFMEDPANKRIFHLVYFREREWLALNSQVMNVAKELCALSGEFVRHVRDEFRDAAQGAWARALKEAQRLAAIYGIQNPFTS